MIKPYDLVVFDWEGTIADTLGVILHTVALEAHALGYGTVDPYQARQYVNLGLVQALRKAYPHLSAQEHEHLLQAVQHALHTRSVEVCLIPGVRELLYQLHDAKVNIAVATNKGQHSLLRAMQATGLDEIIKVTRSAGQVPAKPCPQMLEEIITEFGGANSKTLMIGDSTTDMEMATSINVTAIGVDFYHQQGAALKMAGALEVFDEYKLLADFLNLKKTV